MIGILKIRNRSFFQKMPPHSVAYAAADADFHATLLNAKLAELEKEVRQAYYDILNRAGRLVIRKVLKTRIWGVPPACLGNR